METLERIIAQQRFFAGMDPQYLGLLVSCATNKRFKAGTYILKEGLEANEFYLIRSGRVSLEIQVPQRQPIVIETLSEGDVLGWSWLVSPHVWKFHARATEETALIGLDGKCLRRKCERNHDLGYEMLKRFSEILVERLEATRFQLLDVYALK